MRRCYFCFLFSLFILPLEASPKDAERIKRTYELEEKAWALKLQLATTDAEKQELWKKQPDRNAAAKDLWRVISPSLKEEWTIPHACFFLDLTRSLKGTDAKGNTVAAFVAERRLLIDTFSKQHIGKPGVGSFALALAEEGAPQSLPLLEKIIKENPDEVTQGLASMAAALVLRNLGDSEELIVKRLTHLRTAIIKAADQRIGDMTVGDMAANEVYIIQHLSKGRNAPDFDGTDVAGRAVRLSETRGKITVIFFWDAKSPETDKIIELTNELVVKNQGKDVEFIGITPESLKRIRELQADGSIRWNNIIDPAEKISKEYRINMRPLVFVLDKQGKIEYTGLPGSFVDLTVDALLKGVPAK